MTQALLKQNSNHQTHAVAVRGVFMGLDLSLTKTGMGILTPTDLTTINFLTDADKVKGLARLALVTGGIVAQVEKFRPEAVCIEGYSFGSGASQAHSTGELGGLVRMELAKMGVPTFICPPSNLKQVFTGSGKGAGKGPVMVALLKRFGVEITEDNQADGAALSFIAAMKMGAMPELSLPAANAKGLAKVSILDNPFPRVRRRERENMLQPVAAA